MKNNPNNYWWRTKTFKIGLGVFVVLALLVALFFGDQVGQLLDLFGSRADVAGRTLQINDRVETNPGDGHGYFQDQDANYDGDMFFVDPDPDTEGDGYITLDGVIVGID